MITDNKMLDLPWIILLSPVTGGLYRYWRVKKERLESGWTDYAPLVLAPVMTLIGIWLYQNYCIVRCVHNCS
jgi:hypothetical protein